MAWVCRYQHVPPTWNRGRCPLFPSVPQHTLESVSSCCIPLHDWCLLIICRPIARSSPAIDTLAPNRHLVVLSPPRRPLIRFLPFKEHVVVCDINMGCWGEKSCSPNSLVDHRESHVFDHSSAEALREIQGIHALELGEPWCTAGQCVSPPSTSPPHHPCVSLVYIVKPFFGTRASGTTNTHVVVVDGHEMSLVRGRRTMRYAAFGI